MLYQRGIGTQCAIFYVGWAHYYDSANAFKQAESVYNLGFQASAQPYNVLEQAHKNFRFSLSQRMLYNDQQSKKRSVSQLNDQRQQITTLNPSSSNQQQSPSNPNYMSPSSVNPMNQPQNAYSSPQHQTQQQYYDYNTSSEEQEQQPPLKKARAMEEPRAYNQNFNSSSVPNDLNAQIPSNEKTTEYSNPYASPKVENENLNNSNSSAACAIASSLNSVYSGDEDQCSDDYGAYNYNGGTSSNPTETNRYEDNTLTYSAANDYTSISTMNSSESLPSSCILPPNFAQYAKNHFEPWNGLLYLEESDADKVCKYPRHLVYPGNGSEYSLEELRARNYAKVIEAIKEKNRQQEFALNEQCRLKQIQQQQRIEHEQLMKMQQQRMFEEQQQARQAEQERLRYAEIERDRIQKEEERVRLAGIEMQRAKEQEEIQRLRFVEQQKLQQMKQEQVAYVHQVFVVLLFY